MESPVESLQDILARIEHLYIKTPATDKSPTQRAVPGVVVAPQHAPLTSRRIPAEMFLEHIGFFTPSSKRIKDIYTKEKVVAERIEVDGTKRLVKTKISANHELGLPVTSDLDYYRAFLRLLAEAMERGGRLQLPLAVPTKQLLRYAEKTEGIKNRREIRAFLKKMTLTGIEGGMYRAKTQDFEEGFITTVFRQVIVKGDRLRSGDIADTNYIWPAAWFLANYFRGYIRSIDLDFHNGLRKPIAKALYPLLETGWYASGGQPYEKRYSILCAEFLLRKERYLSDTKKQLEPAYEELKDKSFLEKWAYRKAIDGQDRIITYWPGKKFFVEQKVRAARRQLADGMDTPKKLLEPASRVDHSPLLDDLLDVCGDRQNEAAYRKALQTYPENLLRIALSETRQAANEHRISRAKGAFFFDTLKRLAALRV